MLGLTSDPMLIRVGSQTRAARGLSFRSARMRVAERKKESTERCSLSSVSPFYFPGM
jgi:hypothetical protein